MQRVELGHLWSDIQFILLSGEITLHTLFIHSRKKFFSLMEYLQNNL